MPSQRVIDQTANRTSHLPQTSVVCGILDHMIITAPYDGPLLADGFEDALIGLGFQFNTPIAVYDRAQCLHILMTRDGMTEEDAEEYFSFNVIGAYMGRRTPVFIDRA